MYGIKVLVWLWCGKNSVYGIGGCYVECCYIEYWDGFVLGFYCKVFISIWEI